MKDKKDKLNIDSVLNTNLLHTKATEIIQSVADGEVSPLKVFMAVKAVTKACQYVEDSIKESAITEAEKHGPGSHTIHGITFQVVEAGTSYDYTGSSRWLEIKQYLKELEAQIKAGYTDPETGEIVKAEKTSKTTIRLTYK
jgi:hypothetical protein